MVFELTAKALAASVLGDRVVVHLSDDREVSFPWSRNRKLRSATPAQRAKVELICDGTGLHWPELDEDLSVLGILEGRFGYG